MAVVSKYSLERDGIHQAELCPRNTMMDLYACKSWTLTAKLEKRMQAFEIRWYRRLLDIGQQMETMWFGYISRSSGLAKMILQGTIKRKRTGRQKKRWENSIKEWTGMDFANSARAAERRARWKGIVEKSSLVPCGPSNAIYIRVIALSILFTSVDRVIALGTLFLSVGKL